MSMNESIKKAVDDLDLDRRVDELGKFAHKTYDDLRAQVGTLAHDNRDRVDGWVNKATSALDERTEGKYHDKVVKFSAAVGSAVEKVAEARPDAHADVPLDPNQFEEYSGSVPAQGAPSDGATAFPAQYPSDRHGD